METPQQRRERLKKLREEAAAAAATTASSAATSASLTSSSESSSSGPSSSSSLPSTQQQQQQQSRKRPADEDPSRLFLQQQGQVGEGDIDDDDDDERQEEDVDMQEGEEEQQQQQQQTEEEDDENKDPVVKFRNYNPRTKDLRENKLAKPEVPSIEQQVEPVLEQVKSQIEKSSKSEDVLGLAPMHPNADLKRMVAGKLEKLERQTQKAIIELIKEKLAQDAQGDSEGGGLSLVEAIDDRSARAEKRH